MTRVSQIGPRIVEMLHEGVPQKKIARVLGCSVGTVRYWAKKEKLQPRVAKREAEHAAARTTADERREGTTTGIQLLWSIATDPNAADAARVNAIDKIAGFENWESLLGERRQLPPPLTEVELVERQFSLLESLHPSILLTLFRRLHEEVPEVRDILQRVLKVREPARN